MLPDVVSTGSEKSVVGREGTGTSGSALGRVSPRAKSQVGVDWFRAVGAVGHLSEVVRLLDAMGHGDREECGGRYGFTDRGMRWASGASIHWASTALPGDERCMVDLPGQVCQSIDPDQLVHLMSLILNRGWHCTRCDVKVDFRCAPASIIDQVRESCERQELCGAKTWQPHDEYRGRELINHGVSIGKRGSLGSGRFVRVYDKGLETGECGRGKWERFEVEFSSECANDVAMGICKAMGDWRKHAWSVAMGAIDFRECNGRRDMSRRLRVNWWSRLIEGIDLVRIVAKREKVRLAGYVGWLQRSVFPTLQQMAAKGGTSVYSVITDLLGASGMAAKDDRRVRATVWEWQGLAVQPC